MGFFPPINHLSAISACSEKVKIKSHQLMVRSWVFLALNYKSRNTENKKLNGEIWKCSKEKLSCNKLS